MAPKFKFTRAEITDAALQVVRRNGIGALTARAIADELGVSTQPVFTCFSTMAEARGAVRSAAESIYDGYVEEGLRAEIPFHGFGMQYIRFAREEPELYRLLFLTHDAGEKGAMPKPSAISATCGSWCTASPRSSSPATAHTPTWRSALF